MKKLCAILLAALMLVTMLPFAAFAKVADTDQIMTEILDGEYQHMSFVKENEYFKAAFIAYAVAHPNTWGDQIEGNTLEAKAAKDVLLALIDKIEAELNNETFEKILAGLKGAKTAMDFLGKVNDVTQKLDFVTSEGWGTALSTLNYAIQAGQIANTEYEKYAEGYAAILSIKAASNYYGDLLDYIAVNVADKNIAAAALELKNYITMDLDQASEKLKKEIVDDLGQQGALIAIDAAMNTNAVTAAIKTGYGVVTGAGDKLFNATDAISYSSGMVAVTRIEDIIVPYIKNEISGADEYAADFAKIAMLTLRESGEKMLSNFGKAKNDSIIGKLKKTDDSAALSLAGAKNATKLSVYRDIILADADYTTYLIYVDDTVGKNLLVRDKDGYAIEVLKNNTSAKRLTENGAFYSIYSESASKYIRVVVAFVDGLQTELTKPSSSSSSSSGGGFFASFFAAIAEFFRNLFSFLK